MNNSRVFLICLILISGSFLPGCTTTPVYQPLCGPDRPVLAPLTEEEQWAIMGIDPDLLYKIAENQATLKNHILHWEELADAHNEVYDAACE